MKRLEISDDTGIECRRIMGKIRAAGMRSCGSAFEFRSIGPEEGEQAGPN